MTCQCCGEPVDFKAATHQDGFTYHPDCYNMMLEDDAAKKRLKIERLDYSKLSANELCVLTRPWKRRQEEDR